MAIVSGVIVLVFGTLTLVLHNETFIKIKPTIIYSLFGLILGGGLVFNRSLIAVMFDQMFNLTPRGWRLLTIRWAVFFFAMAILNEIIWRTQRRMSGSRSRRSASRRSPRFRDDPVSADQPLCPATGDGRCRR